MRISALGLNLLLVLSALSVSVPVRAEIPGWMESVPRSRAIQERSLSAPDYHSTAQRTRANKLSAAGVQFRLCKPWRRTYVSKACDTFEVIDLTPMAYELEIKAR